MINLQNFNIGDSFFDANGEKGEVIAIQEEFLVVRPYYERGLKIVFSNDAHLCFSDMFTLFQAIKIIFN